MGDIFLLPFRECAGPAALVTRRFYPRLHENALWRERCISLPRLFAKQSCRWKSRYKWCAYEDLGLRDPGIISAQCLFREVSSCRRQRREIYVNVILGVIRKTPELCTIGAAQSTRCRFYLKVFFVHLSKENTPDPGSLTLAVQIYAPSNILRWAARNARVFRVLSAALIVTVNRKFDV